MSEFLDDLEHELLSAARRRSRESRHHAAGRWQAMRLMGDLRAMGSGAMLAASVGVVVVVMAFVSVSGIHHSTARTAPSVGGNSPLAPVHDRCGSTAAISQDDSLAVGAPPDPQLSALLHVGRHANAHERRLALSNLDQRASGATAVYVRDIRVLHLPHGLRVTLLGVQSCMTIGWRAGHPTSSPRPSVVAELRARHGVATILLGSVGQIQSGAAFRARTLLLKSSGGLESVAMVPAGVARVVCHSLTDTAAVQRFRVSERLAVLPATASDTDCNLSFRGSGGSDA